MEIMDLSERKRKILSAIIENYIDTAEPVGSKAIAQTTGLGVSSARQTETASISAKTRHNTFLARTIILLSTPSLPSFHAQLGRFTGVL